jgi:two-component system, chemotaxis family, chemotaxis protein CheY
VTRPFRPTGRLTRLDPKRELVHLIVDFDDATDFLSEYDARISQNSAVIATDRQLPDGTPIQLRISFPGLLEPIVLDGHVRTPESDTPGMFVKLRSDRSVNVLVEQVRRKDPAVVLPLFRVLLVEDNHHVAQLVANGLAASARRELGPIAFAFTVASDGAAALALLNETRFDAAIVDVYMPVLDGPRLIRHIRETLHLDMPIIGLSGGGEPARRAALGAGATLFLDKPVRLRQVVETIRQIMKVEPS